MGGTWCTSCGPCSPCPRPRRRSGARGSRRTPTSSSPSDRPGAGSDVKEAVSRYANPRPDTARCRGAGGNRDDGGARDAPPPAGTISGKVTYTGTPPKMKPIDMAKEPFCARLHAAAPVLTETAVTGPGNALRWVLVYVSAGDQGSAPATQPVRLDQRSEERR